MKYPDRNTFASRLQNHDLYSLRLAQKRYDFDSKITGFQQFIDQLSEQGNLSYFREIASPMERSVLVRQSGEKERELLMFGSNNYLGFANDPYIKEKVKESIDRNGVGVAGPPILNGYSSQHQFLERRIADLKNSEDALIFPSGYQTNLGLIGGLLGKKDRLYIDELSHASTIDAIRMAGIKSKKFRHNSCNDLRDYLDRDENDGQLFVGFEGLYSMDGDVCPLDELVGVIKNHSGICFLDDAHGTGIIGDHGKGVIEQLKIPFSDILHIGTFSKSFAVNGGFIAGSKPLISYIRYHARSYMFSASLANTSVAAVHAGLDLIEKEPWRREKLRSLNRHIKKALAKIDLATEPASAIIAVKVPPAVDIRKACTGLFDLGFFVNAVEYPAVKRGEERLRISLMVHHEKEDIDQLAEAIKHVFEKHTIL